MAKNYIESAECDECLIPYWQDELFNGVCSNCCEICKEEE